MYFIHYSCYKNIGYMRKGASKQPPYLRVLLRRTAPPGFEIPGSATVHNNPDSMTTLFQRWQTVVPLADSWRWMHNAGPTFCQHQHVLYENWKVIPFILLILESRC